MAARATFDQIEINPTSERVTSLLEAAVTTANARFRIKTITWPLVNLDAFLTDLQSTPEGIRGWHGGVKPNYFEGRCQAIVIWWTDPIDRKHVRVLGGNGPELHMFKISLMGARLRKRAIYWPLEQLYPRRAARIWRQGQAPTLVMLCACGALGTPAALHWMGTCCGPCHDRGIDGTRVAASAIPGRAIYRKLAFSPDSRTLAVVNDGISLVDLETSEVTVVPLPDPSECKMRGFLADGRLMLCKRTKTDQDIALWKPGDSTLLHHNFSQIGRDEVVLSPGGNLLAACGEDGLKVFALPECRLLWAFEASPVHHVVFSHDNGWLTALGSIDHPGPQRVFEAGTGKLVHEFPEHGGRFRVAISSGGQFAVGVAPYPPMNLVLANLRDSPPSVSEVTPKWSLDCVRFDPSGRYLFARESNPLIWELPDLERPIELEWGNGEILDVAWSPDGRWLATGDNMGQLRLWPWRELLGLIDQTRVSDGTPDRRRE